MRAQRYATPSWSSYFTPQRCDDYGRTQMPAGLDWERLGADQPANAWLDSWNRSWGGLYDSWVQVVNSSWAPFYPPQSQTTRRQSAERCQDCERDDCDCRCCVGDADLLVHARVGERRVVPLVIENDSRRERPVELDLSDWTSHNNQAAVKVGGQLLPPLAFTLAPCSEQSVTLVVEVQGSEDENKDRAGMGDVQGCQVYYADLRVKGCDIRPVRIALALHSRDCGPLTINCRCDCC